MTEQQTKAYREWSALEIACLVNNYAPTPDPFVEAQAVKELEAKLEKAQADITLLRGALGFYADRRHWLVRDMYGECKDTILMSDLGCKSMNEDADFMIPSGGRLAREALKKGDE